LDIAVLYTDASLLAISKPAGLSVHEAPGPGSSVLRELREGQGLSGLTPVHRLDKDASGVLLLAKSKEIAALLQSLWSRAEKTYWAICEGVPPQTSGTIDALLLEHQTGKPERLANAVRYYKKTHPDAPLPPLPAPKSSAVHVAGRSAQTDYRLIESFGRWSWLEVRPHQGRMHQIRVHLAHLGCPLAVDTLYGRRKVLLARDLSSESGEPDAVILSRMPLHAAKLAFPDPRKSERLISVEAPLPADMEKLLIVLRAGAHP
jgi:23S rRNA-/tRNA-specific pseudouridylate synthase